MTRKKPMGEEYELFALEWSLGSHNDKIRLAGKYNVSYDTAKHWVSEGSTDPRGVVTELVEPDAPSLIPEVTEGVNEIRSLRSKVNLDFVSFDLETTDLKADFAIILCACIKPFGGKPITFRGDQYPTWKDDRANDGLIVKDIADELRKHAIVMTHYGTGFDIPFLRAKMMHEGLEPLPSMFQIDTFRIAKNNFKVSSRGLKNLVYYAGVGAKGGVERCMWERASLNGDKKAMDDIVAYNILDCEVLESLAMVSFPYLKSIRKM